MKTSDPDYRALRLFAQYLARQVGGKSVSFEKLCEEHPELESRLQRLAQLRAEAKADAPLVAAARNGMLRKGRGSSGDSSPISVTGSATLDPAAVEQLQDGHDPSRYVLLREISRGTMGAVLHVWDTVLRRPLAMKVLDPDTVPEGSEEASKAVARFLEEAQVAGQLEHPGVVPIHDLGADENGRVYFTMPLIEGRNGNEVFDLARAELEGWSLTRALAVLGKVCEAVAYAHSRGVIHRDLKPANVMVGKFGETYVVDWGLAKVVGASEAEPLGADSRTEPSASSEKTVDGSVIGTPAYMAPEQAEGRVADITFQADVYALGAMLYRLLAGRSPYAPRHGKDDAAKTLELVRRGPPTPLERVAPGTPPELVAIATRAMARRPEDRHASVEELADELRAFHERRISRARWGGFLARGKELLQRKRWLAAIFGAHAYRSKLAPRQPGAGGAA